MFRFVLAGLLGLAAVPGYAQVIRTQDFSVDPGWTLIGHGTNGNNFGYQSTSNSGGSMGEAGGRFTRSTFIRTYADTNLLTPLNLNQPFSASGLFNFTNDNTPDFGTGLVIGHFQVTGPGSIGMVFNNNGTGVLHWRAGMFLNNGVEVSATSSSLLSNVQRSWSMNWDPSGGGLGGGRLTVALSGTGGGGTQTVDLTPAQRGFGLDVDAFGFNSEAALTSLPDRLADIFIDDVTYVVGVPEPSSMVLMSSFAVATAWRVRRRTRRISAS